jgi:hypothetical protein
MSQTVTLERVKGVLYIVEEVYNYTIPEKQTLRWIARGDGHKVPDDQLGIPLILTAYGSSYRVNGIKSPHGSLDVYIFGSDKAETNTSTEVPPPKVRAGIETRWRNGAWEKYLRSKGWELA